MTVASVRLDNSCSWEARNNFKANIYKNESLYFMYLPHRNTQAWNLSGEKQRDTWSKEQTWTTPLRYIFMSIWFFCHLGLDEGSTDLRTNRKTNKEMSEQVFFSLFSATPRQSMRNETSVNIVDFVLFLVFICLQVKHPLQSSVDIFDAEQDQSIEHCRQKKNIMHA